MIIPIIGIQDPAAAPMQTPAATPPIEPPRTPPATEAIVEIRSEPVYLTNYLVVKIP